MHRARKLSSKSDVDLRRLGTAGPFVDDSITGRGVVLGRAATKLRSIETHPLTGGSTYQKTSTLWQMHTTYSMVWTGYGSPPC